MTIPPINPIDATAYDPTQYDDDPIDSEMEISDRLREAEGCVVEEEE